MVKGVFDMSMCNIKTTIQCTIQQNDFGKTVKLIWLQDLRKTINKIRNGLKTLNAKATLLIDKKRKLWHLHEQAAN